MSFSETVYILEILKFQIVKLKLVHVPFDFGPRVILIVIGESPVDSFDLLSFRPFPCCPCRSELVEKISSDSEQNFKEW